MLMKRNSWWIAAGLGVFLGCQAQTEPTPGVSSTPAETVGSPEGETTPGVTEVSLSQEEMEQIKALPEAEQPEALAQKVCPISGENLGSMGKPIKVTADDKTAYLCCEGCKKEYEADPAAALAKLKE